MSCHIKKGFLFWTVSTCLWLTVGCSKLTTENYNQLKAGMQYDEVVEILGEADACKGAIGIKNCKWGDDKKYIKVNFVGGKVVLFSGQGL